MICWEVFSEGSRGSAMSAVYTDDLSVPGTTVGFLAEGDMIHTYCVNKYMTCKIAHEMLLEHILEE